MKLTVILTKKIIAIACAITTIIVGFGDRNVKYNYYEPVETKTYVLMEAYNRCQGITNDGESFYFSSNTGLIKTDLDGKTIIKSNYSAIPFALLLKGCTHIGGISYMDGKVYAPIEDSKKFNNLYIAEYDAETLKLITYHALPLEKQENGVPWCVADEKNHVIYTARRDYIETVNIFDADTFELIKEIKLSGTVHKVQGGEMYKGILYLSVSRGTQSVYAVNPLTGEVQQAFERNLVDGSEGEGMTVLPMDDTSLFHVLDIANIRLGVHLRSYYFDVNSLKWSKS